MKIICHHLKENREGLVVDKLLITQTLKVILLNFLNFENDFLKGVKNNFLHPFQKCKLFF